MTRWILLLALALLLWRLLRALSAPRRGAGHRPPADATAEDPHRVLGVARGASGAEIAHAYRARLKEYHPDRVASLGPELQELAHRKTIEIQRAWETLRTK